GGADLVAQGPALGTQPIRLPERLATFAIELERCIDLRGILALRDRAVTDRRRVLAQSRQPDAHRSASSADSSTTSAGLRTGTGPAASRSRPMTKPRSRLASSQPARGP